MDAKSNNSQNCSSYKLKFGIDRLLSSETSSSNLFHDFNFGQKQNNSLAVPCSGCVTSMLRCCSLNPRSQNLHQDCSGYSNLNLVTAGSIYSIQPIRPFATRPQVRVNLSPSPSISPTQINSSQGNNSGKRKRSWSRAVFSNLQRKGLERRFQLQKYITKPDRRQLAATLGLTDAQVKVWFQNRRMKWRHTKEISKDIESTADSTQEEMLIDVDTIQEND